MQSIAGKEEDVRAVLSMEELMGRLAHAGFDDPHLFVAVQNLFFEIEQVDAPGQVSIEDLQNFLASPQLCSGDDDQTRSEGGTSRSSSPHRRAQSSQRSVSPMNSPSRRAMRASSAASARGAQKIAGSQTSASRTGTRLRASSRQTSKSTTPPASCGSLPRPKATARQASKNTTSPASCGLLPLPKGLRHAARVLMNAKDLSQQED